MAGRIEMQKVHSYMLLTAAVVVATVAGVVVAPAYSAPIPAPTIEASMGASDGCGERLGSGACTSQGVNWRADVIGTWHFGFDDFQAYTWQTQDGRFADKNDSQGTYGLSYKFGSESGWFIRPFGELWDRQTKDLGLFGLEGGKVLKLESGTLKLSVQFENLWSKAYVGSNYAKDLRFQAAYGTTVLGQPVSFFGAVNGYEAPGIKRVHFVGSASSDFKLFDLNSVGVYVRPAVKWIVPIYTKGGLPRDDPMGNIGVWFVFKRP